MMAFDHVFGEVARRDSRAIAAIDRAGTPATFVFREFYCVEPRCDCRRVLLQMYWVEGKRVAASINYGFERSKRSDEPQIFLDPMNPQSEHSRSLLELFAEMIEKEGAYRAQLHRHYAMWKQVVDDPAHPEHAKVRGAAHDDASLRPAFPRRSRPRRTRERPGQPAAATGLDLVVAKAARAEGKLQQRFKRLLEKVDRLRQRLRVWKEQRPDIDRELAAYSALFGEQGRRCREMVSLLDRAYADAAFNKAERKKLATMICAMAGSLIEQGGHDDLKTIYNRYSRSDFDAEVAAEDAAGVDALKAMMEMFGVDFGDAEISSIEELQAINDAQLEALEREEAAARERRGRRKKSAKQLASEARREDEQRSANKAVQDIYRRLAMELHPDREQDPEERARKAELMREVNIAYEAKDLLRLLELQLQLERVDATRVEILAEERVQHYNRILDEQSRQLAAQLEELELPFRMELGLSPSARLAPADVIAQIRGDAEELRRHNASLARDLEVFADTSRLKAWLKTQGRTRRRGNPRGADLFS